MGQIQDKCSCMFKKEDKETFKFEKENQKDDDSMANEKIVNKKFTNKKSFSFKDNFLKAKSNKSREGTVESAEDITMLPRNKKFDNIPDNAIPYQQIIQFQSVVRGKIFRNKLPQVKSSLKEIEDELISAYEKNFKLRQSQYISKAATQDPGSL